MRVLVVTVVHTPLDARIHERQIRALVEAGAEVTYAAPWSGHGIDPAEVRDGVVAIDVPRATGRRRAAAVLAARRLLAELGRAHDVILLHDPELLTAVAGLALHKERVVVWDVHEDTGAALIDKQWLPAAVRPMVAFAVGRMERWAQRRLRLLLAESRYAERLGGGPDGHPHPVVPNTPLVPDDPPPGPVDPPRVVHVGRLSVGRGVHDLLAVGAGLGGDAELHLYGVPDDDVAAEVRAAHARGDVVFHGFVPNARALGEVEGAVAGLALLHDLPNYRHSMPTKIHEYLGRAVPAITTPLPEAVAVVEQADAGVVVPFEDPAAVVAAVRALIEDPQATRAMGERGHAHVRDHHAWNSDGRAFVRTLRGWLGHD